MGLYNTYGNVQLKCGKSEMDYYKIGDVVDLADGLYLGWGGFIAVMDRKLVAEWPEVTDSHNKVHTATDTLRMLWHIDG